MSVFVGDDSSNTLCVSHGCLIQHSLGVCFCACVGEVGGCVCACVCVFNQVVDLTLSVLVMSV